MEKLQQQYHVTEKASGMVYSLTAKVSDLMSFNMRLYYLGFAMLVILGQLLVMFITRDLYESIKSSVKLSHCIYLINVITTIYNCAVVLKICVLQVIPGELVWMDLN